MAFDERPDWVRRLNALGDSAGGPDRMVALDVDEMCQSAIDSVGLDDFGDVDGDWQARLRSLVAEIDETARMHTVGRMMTRAEILRCLRTRLTLGEDAKRRPAVLDEVVREPVVVTGPARSGTSLLLELLDLDPALRGADGGDVVEPLAAADDARLARAEGEYELWSDVHPGFRAVHDLKASYPQECIHLQMPAFAGTFWTMIADIPGWEEDQQAAMQFHRRVLQTLQHGHEGTWVLKTPVYLAMLDLLFETYPDAWVIHNHRDPVKTTASGASTLANVRWIRSDHVDTRGIAGGDMGMLMLWVMDRRMKGELPERIVDVHFADLLDDPAASVERAYATMGREFTGSHADAIRRYVADRPQNAFGRHEYAAEEYGIDDAEIRERMRPYTDYYGITLE